jgi:uncharacterized protein YukE
MEQQEMRELVRAAEDIASQLERIADMMAVDVLTEDDTAELLPG